ncbi:MAG: hypothetical protein ACKVQT_12760 [Burkholderiales bacterium]
MHRLPLWIISRAAAWILFLVMGLRHRFGLVVVAVLTISGCSGSVFVRSDATHGATGSTVTSTAGGHARAGVHPPGVGARIGSPGPPSGSSNVRIGSGGAQLSAHGPAGLVLLGALIVSGLVEYVFRKMEERPSTTEEELIERPR